MLNIIYLFIYLYSGYIKEISKWKSEIYHVVDWKEVWFMIYDSFQQDKLSKQKCCDNIHQIVYIMIFPHIFSKNFAWTMPSNRLMKISFNFI
jgi:hypothetical protein